jgi:hypothetical protein
MQRFKAVDATPSVRLCPALRARRWVCPELGEERGGNRLGAALGCPHDPTRLVAHDAHQVPVAFAIDDLIQADPGRTSRPSSPRVTACSPTTRGIIRATDVQSMRINSATTLLGADRTRDTYASSKPG